MLSVDCIFELALGGVDTTALPKGFAARFAPPEPLEPGNFSLYPEMELRREEERQRGLAVVRLLETLNETAPLLAARQRLALASSMLDGSLVPGASRQSRRLRSVVCELSPDLMQVIVSRVTGPHVAHVLHHKPAAESDVGSDSRPAKRQKSGE